MKLVVGLGNPGAEYEATRHNLGFTAVKGFAKENGLRFAKKEFNSYYAKGCGACLCPPAAGEGRRSVPLRGGFALPEGGCDTVLVLPLTYMNLTGPAVLSFLNKYKCSASDLLVVCDDMALPLGSLRLRPGGSAGGHNGLKSIIDSIKTNEFSRLRLGIGKDRYVLDTFSRGELKQVKGVVETSCAVIEEWLTSGVEKAMAKWNRRVVNA